MKTKIKRFLIAAAKGQMFHCAINKVVIEAADGEGKKNPTIEILAYTGVKMNVGFGYPVILDLSKLTQAAHVSLLKDHDHAKLLGQATLVDIGDAGVTIHAEFTAPEDSESRKEVLGNAANGYSWPASLGAAINKIKLVGKGKSAMINGSRQKGPFYAVEGEIREISVVSVAADGNTESSIAATLAANNTEETNMDPKFKAWLEAKSHDVDALDEAKVAELKAKYDAEIKAEKKPEKKPEKIEAGDNPSEMMRLEAVAEKTRIMGINAIEAKTPELQAMQAKAIADGAGVVETELAMLKAARLPAPDTSFGIRVGSDDKAVPNIIEAAMHMSGGIPEAEILAQFGEETMQAAHTKHRRGLSLQQIILQAAWAGGYSGAHFDTGVQGLTSILTAAFSTMSLPGILGNVANKFLLSGFDSVESDWRKISSFRNVKDFKQVTSYQMTGDMEYAKLAPGGKIEHGELGERNYTNQAATYAKMFSLDRTDIINDDLGAFTDLPRRMGRGAALKFNKVFWTVFMDNSSFFTSGNSNYQEGSMTNLSLDSLTAANLLFKDMKTPDNNPMGAKPKFLLVPNALEVLATQIIQSPDLNETTTANKGKVTKNPHVGRFEVVSSSYLGWDALTGYSILAFYLLANPLDIPVIETAFLNGIQTPTVEQASADFDTLGIQFRGFHDFGVKKQMTEGGVKSKGEA